MTEKSAHLTEDQLQAYFDGALDPGAARNVQAHLASCPTCQEAFSRLESLAFQLENLPEFDLTRELAEPVISRLRVERSLSPGITWTLIIEALAAGTALGLLIPAIRSAGWLSGLLPSQQALQATLNIYLTQLASSWLVWWAGLRLQISHLSQGLLAEASQLPVPISPWILIAAAGGLGILINYLLLGRQTVSGRNLKRR